MESKLQYYVPENFWKVPERSQRWTVFFVTLPGSEQALTLVCCRSLKCGTGSSTSENSRMLTSFSPAWWTSLMNISRYPFHTNENKTLVSAQAHVKTFPPLLICRKSAENKYLRTHFRESFPTRRFVKIVHIGEQQFFPKLNLY